MLRQRLSGPGTFDCWPNCVRWSRLVPGGTGESSAGVSHGKRIPLGKKLVVEMLLIKNWGNHRAAEAATKGTGAAPERNLCQSADAWRNKSTLTYQTRRVEHGNRSSLAGLWREGQQKHEEQARKNPFKPRIAAPSTVETLTLPGTVRRYVPDLVGEGASTWQVLHLSTEGPGLGGIVMLVLCHDAMGHWNSGLRSPGADSWQLSGQVPATWATPVSW
jgi:hypothetical protein